MRLHRPAPSVADGVDPVVITPESAGWRYVGLRVVVLPAGGTRTIATGADEMLVLPLTGSAVVDIDGTQWTLEGRTGVFDRVSDFVYAPTESHVRLTSPTGGEFALPSARASRRLTPMYGAAMDVSVEVRGAGSATRQITNFFAPGVLEAERLVAVEVLTPGGNTSSYPPHKHDDDSGGREAELEEIYYFRFATREAFGMHRTYAADGGFDETATVHDGDVFLVPNGYHGPSVAMPGYDMYYLNVLAGPKPIRSLAFSDDPAHAWIRPSWTGVPRDPRLPMTSRIGKQR